jgi:hypothetical protein
VSNSFYHADYSANRYGGRPEDYQHLHDWFDATKECFADFRHRALRHHSQGVFELERQFGKIVTNSDGRDVPVRLIGEDHVKQDCGGRIPTVEDWLGELPIRRRMNTAYRT